MHKLHLNAILGLALAGLPAATMAQEIDKPCWYMSSFAGRSARIFGSKDIRTDFGIGIAWQKPEPHFRWLFGPSELVLEGYYEHSTGEFRHSRGRVTDAIGAIWYGRFRFRSQSLNLFFDIGEGVQLSNSESYDLGTRLNSSPMFAAGVSIRQGKQETMLGFRLLHLSNADFNSINRGQNQMLFYVAVKY